MLIAEIYKSIQGEGEFAGTPSVFIRTSGCNLRCWFCDTPFTSWHPEGENLTVDQVVAEVSRLTGDEGRHVVLTGGEPLIQAPAVELTQELRNLGSFITTETAGTVYLPVATDLMSISPKRANSTPPVSRSEVWSRQHEERRHVPEVIRQLTEEYVYQFKFVIDQPADVDDVCRYLDELSFIDRERVWLMPQATTREELSERSAWVHEAADRASLRFSSRQHIAQFGNARGH